MQEFNCFISALLITTEKACSSIGTRCFSFYEIILLLMGVADTDQILLTYADIIFIAAISAIISAQG